MSLANRIGRLSKRMCSGEGVGGGSSQGVSVSRPLRVCMQTDSL